MLLLYLTIKQISDKKLSELQQWKIDIHQLVDEIFLAKSKKIKD
jgi:hypothetical protein